MSRRALLAALVLVIAGITAPVAADTIETIDADHDLTDQSTIEQYDETGTARADLVTPNMSLTVAENHDDVGLDGIWLDFDSRYLRVQYNETVDRTIRFYIPSEYWHPLTSLDKEAVNTDLTADFRPSTSGRYTVVSMDVDGPTDAVFEIQRATTGVFFLRSKSRTVVENTTGYDTPRIGSAGEWKYVPEDSLDGNASYPINASDGATVQYDAGTGENATWLAVPDCGGVDAPVCLYEKRGQGDTEYVLSTTQTAPDVRWKASEDLSAQAGSAWNDLQLVPDRIWDTINGLLGRGENE